MNITPDDRIAFFEVLESRKKTYESEVKDVFKYEEIGPEKTEWYHHVFAQLLSEQNIEKRREEPDGSNYWQLTYNGQALLDKMRRTRDSEIIEAQNRAEDRKLITDTNKISGKVGESTLRLNIHQRITMWLTFSVAALTLYVSYRQYRINEDQIHSEKQEQSALGKIDSTLQKIDLTLERTHDLYLLDSLRLNVLDSLVKYEIKKPHK